MQKKQLSVLVLIILCFLLGCNRETPKDESQQNYEDESNISKTNGEELVNINSELLGSTPFDIQIDKTALQKGDSLEIGYTGDLPDARKSWIPHLAYLKATRA